MGVKQKENTLTDCIHIYIYNKFVVKEVVTMGGKVSYICVERENNTSAPGQFPEMLDYKTGLCSKGKVTRNESFKCGAGRQSWGLGFKDPSWKGRGVGEVDGNSVDMVTEENPTSEHEETFRQIQNVF